MRSSDNCLTFNRRPNIFAAVIVAAGAGTRAGGDVPKQFQPFLDSNPVLICSEVFLRHPDCVGCVVVVPEGWQQKVQQQMTDAFGIMDRISVVVGGSERALSVQYGVRSSVQWEPDALLIHDAARAGVTDAVINRLLQGLVGYAAAAPALKPSDALKRKAQDGGIQTVDRSDVYRVQTPQAFWTDALTPTFEVADQAWVDDLARLEGEDLPINLVEGDIRLTKITHPDDFETMELLLSDKTPDVRTGTGFDVHAFEPGNEVQLCGVAIAHDQSLKGHSDADVGWHALTDAILGALCEGDIGDHFPPSDDQWKGAPSSVFLSFAADRVRARNGKITHADISLICEAPKIKPHREEMRKATADVLGLPFDRVSIKATTTEQLGFTGRKEGIAAMASATVVL